MPLTRAVHIDIYVRDEELYARQMLYTYSTYTRYATPCCYCGDPATEKDHLLPFGAWIKMTLLQRDAVPRHLLRIVPSCVECNSLAGGKVFFSFEEKVVFIKARLAEKYRKILHMPHWGDEDIAKLRGRLRKYVQQGQTQREVILERLRY